MPILQRLQRDRQKAFKMRTKKALLINKNGVTLTDTQAVLTGVVLSKTATKKRGLPFAHLPKKGGYHTKKRGLPFTLLSLSNIINIIKRKTPFLGGRFLYRLRIIPRYTELTKVRLWQD